MSDANTFRDDLADELVARAKALQPLLRQNAMSAELDREVSAENIQALHKADIWALTLPKRWGGLGVSATTWRALDWSWPRAVHPPRGSFSS